LSLSHEEFVEASLAVGSSNAWVIFKHIVPNAIGPIIVQATLGIANTIIVASSLSFIGLGIQPPVPEWGAMLAEGKEFLRYYPYIVIFPGIAIILTVLSLNLLGDGLQEAIDPRLKN
jgi:peptide/nickel transport system permease protein